MAFGRGITSGRITHALVQGMLLNVVGASVPDTAAVARAQMARARGSADADDEPAEDLMVVVRLKKFEAITSDAPGKDTSLAAVTVPLHFATGVPPFIDTAAALSTSPGTTDTTCIVLAWRWNLE